MLRTVQRRLACAAVLTLAAATPAAAAPSDSARLHCRGTRMLVEEGGETLYRWVERVFEIDYAQGEVRDGAGRALDAVITPDEVRIAFELEGWPPGRRRIVRIDRADGSWSERPAGSTTVLDEATGTCFRLAVREIAG